MTRRLQIGEMIGDYRVIGFLGEGGMGSVYHGIHTKIDRPAAIKVLSSPAHGSTFKERFFNEARVQSSLHHPNIATLFDFQESPNRDELFIVMEYVDGETLDALIGRRYFAVEDALVTFKSICEAVKFIHENNIVHRDIKPQNIKISSRGTVKMLDFGIAKDAISDGLTRIGGIVGTPNYLAPEQLMGETASPLTDIWALGVLFYEMLTGAAPFKGSTLAELHGQITTARFEPAQRVNASVSADVAKIVDKCLSVDVGQRYRSVDAVLEDVSAALRRRQHPAADQAKVSGIRDLLSRTGSSGTYDYKPIAGGSSLLLKASIGVASVFVVFAVLVFALWATSGPTYDDPPNNGKPAGPPGVNGQTRNVKPQGGRLTTQSGQNGTSTQKAKARIDVTEGVAEVFRDGQLIGTTPVEINGSENETVNLTLKRSGYQDLVESIEITTRRTVFTFTLRKSR